jgi:cytochrome oxidase Cu insertion factor (SCO1/SenC/PrrC family)
VTRRALAAALAAAVVTAAVLGTGAGRGRAQGKNAVLDDLLFDLQLVPLDGQTPPPFTLERLDSTRVSLADYRGRPVLLYFWASW